MHDINEPPLDFYLTPTVAVQRLYAMRPELLKTTVWDPFAGENGVTEAVRAAGGSCIGDQRLNYYEPEKAPSDTCIVHPPHGTADHCCRLLTVLDCSAWALLPLSWIGTRWGDDIFHRIREILVLGKLEMEPLAGKWSPAKIDCAWILFKPLQNSNHQVILDRAWGDFEEWPDRV